MDEVVVLHGFTHLSNLLVLCDCFHEEVVYIQDLSNTRERERGKEGKEGPCQLIYLM
jgi:hypothetical protein